jgi:hypothetical protein
MSTMTEDGSWATVPREVAKQHPLYGISGWLILVALGLILTPLRIAAELAPIYTSIDYASLHPTMTAFVVGEILVNAIVVLWSLANVLLLFTKSELFPRSYIALLATSAVFVPLDAVATKLVTDSIGQTMQWSQIFDPDTIRETFRAIVGAAIWIPYALVSRRVNVTFLNRVRGDDPLLRESVSRVF